MRRVLLAMPRYRQEAALDAATAFYHAMPFEGPYSEVAVRHISPATSLLACCFNSAWARARDDWEDGKVSHFAMIHADLAPEVGWLGKLMGILDATGADVVGAVAPIKDARGLSSTGVDDAGSFWRVRRLTMAEVHDLPEVFGEEDVGGPLALNSGLWLAKLGPWCLDVHFRMHDAILRYPHPDDPPEIAARGGRWRARCMSEDFDFSRQLRAKGLRLLATRAVRVRHHGDHAWDSAEVWGWETDRDNPRAVDRAGVP